ncbi:hypothetical protein [Sphingobium sp. D43FB]|uniref:hypothetical protein n=1 Tax=Sphingobium sp. D43FB TaxID=2017595 RepID=UPI000BB5633C|nr:hypothetical protein [Sphingobium sp. D43FB]PBN41459.1 hypothetical protein SxD43FB_21745 [Sphingobium sp. D43FB]
MPELVMFISSFSARLMSSSFSHQRLYRPGIVASKDQRIANAHDRSRPLLEVIQTMPGATVPEMVRALNVAGHRAARGGPITHNTVTRALGRIGQVPLVAPRSSRTTKSRKNIRARAKRYEVFRTPAYCYELLFDRHPEWFTGRGFDPAAGDGRMIREIIRRGNPGPHVVNDIREEERPALIGCGEVTIGDYLSMVDPPACDYMITNPPFTKAVEFVQKARTHVSGPICILQSTRWQSTQKRSEWLRTAGLAQVLNLPRRPQWEVDSGEQVRNNVMDFAWYVFLPGYCRRPEMDWLVESDQA